MFVVAERAPDASMAIPQGVVVVVFDVEHFGHITVSVVLGGGSGYLVIRSAPSASTKRVRRRARQ
jgi:hypothetical protein